MVLLVWDNLAQLVHNQVLPVKSKSIVDFPTAKERASHPASEF